MEELTNIRKPVFVFSHPNHEIAVFGLLTKLQPAIIYLTDGGGEHRLKETREGLHAAKVENATFLNFEEKTLYDALLEMEVSVIQMVCDRVRAALARLESYDAIFCDAVEWYNPVHDLSLPIVQKVAHELALIYEVPLIHQDPTGFVFQRAAVGRRKLERQYTVPDAALDIKERAWKETYKILYGQYGAMLGNVREVARIETVMPGGDPTRNVDAGAVLRYDDRGQQLHGVKAITRDRHYLPLVDALRKAG